jgi:predicted LPLAT superfamily acyltransferase
MSNKWDGKTRGSLLGYKFFIFCIRTLGVKLSYFFCFFVAIYFVFFAKKQRIALVNFFRLGFNKSGAKANRMAFVTFYKFGQTLIDRIALMTSRSKQYTFEFNNEKVLFEMLAQNKGGVLISGHVGNWENAGNLIKERITAKINVVMLDAEVEKIKSYLHAQTGGPKFNIIPIKDDLSHIILIHQALKRNEFIAIHADRINEVSKNIELDFLGQKTKFPIGPFTIAHKFKVPITFVFAVKESSSHYKLSATDPIYSSNSEMEIAEKYVACLEEKVKKTPTQWFNFYEYFEG